MSKNQEITQIKNEENNALVKMMNYKEESNRLANKIKIMQKKLDKVLSEPNYNKDSDLSKVDVDRLEIVTNLKQEYKNIRETKTILEEKLLLFEKKSKYLIDENNYLRKELNNIPTNNDQQLTKSSLHHHIKNAKDFECLNKELSTELIRLEQIVRLQDKSKKEAIDTNFQLPVNKHGHIDITG